MIDFPALLALVNLIIIIVGAISGWFVLRGALAKSEGEIQERVRGALHDENEVLRSQVQRLEADNKRLSRLMQVLIVSLRKLHGIELDIDDDIITLRASNGSVSRVSADSP